MTRDTNLNRGSDTQYKCDLTAGGGHERPGRTPTSHKS